MLNPKQLMGMLQQSQNPMGVITQQFGNNPRMKEFFQILKDNNTPESIEKYVRNRANSQKFDLQGFFKNQFGLNIQ